jgi:RsiW-degrading membrane proteinase PrsW (M82 family)
MSFGGSYFWREAWFLLEFFILTFFTRTVLFRTSASTFLKGLYVGCLLTLLANGLIAWIYPERDQNVFFNCFYVAFTEEFFKFLPVLLTAYLLFQRQKQKLNSSDWVWLSVLSGAAFSMAEKVMFDRIYFPFTYGPHIGPFYFFPDALGISAYGGAFGYIGHAAATGFVGITMALGLLLKNKVSAIKKLWWAIPLTGFLWVALEHAFNNGHHTKSSSVWGALGGGQTTPYLFLIGLLIILIVDGVNLIRYLKKTPRAWHELVSHVKKLKRIFSTSSWKGLQAVWLWCVELRLINLMSRREEK